MIYRSNPIDITKVSNGTPGQPGQPGQPGNSLYTWIVYADDDKGTNLDTENSAGKAYMGVAYNKTEKVESKNPKDYKWSKIQGAPGKDGTGYSISSNQAEIIKFIERKENINTVLFSPETVTFSFYEKKDNKNIPIKVSKVQSENNEPIKNLTNEESFFYQITYVDESIEYDITDFFTQKDDNSTALDITAFVAKDFEIGTKPEVVKRQFMEGQGFLKVKLLDKKLLHGAQVLSTHIVFLRFGVNKDLAIFNIHAAGFNAAVQNSKVKFSAEGLSITNGGFSIYQTGQTVEKTLEIDPDGNLRINGYGKFKGDIFADSGSFANCTIEQNAKVKGDLSIGEQDNQIIIGNKFGQKGIFSESYNLDNNTGFFISPEGKIVANEIQLGTKAEIKDYLKVGSISNEGSEKYETYIYGGTNSEDFIAITKDNRKIFNLNKWGILTLSNKENGGVVINGQDSSIKSESYSSGASGWKISSDKAEFNNIVARGAIKSSVFSKGEIQTVGGTILIRPTALIDRGYRNNNEQEKGIVLYDLDGFDGVRVGDYCQIGNGPYYQVVNKDDNRKGIYILPIKETSYIFDAKDYSNIYDSTFLVEDVTLKGKVFVTFCRSEKKENNMDKTLIEEIFTDNVGIAINSNSDQAGYAPRSISIFTSKIDRSKKQPILEKNNKIILGQLNGEGGLNGYGLYAENVFLKGQLISESPKGEIVVSKKYFSGINTNSNVPMPNPSKAYFPDYIDDEGKRVNKEIGNIILWAGAKSAQDEDIKKSPFKVDTYGNLYANSGYFEGTIITKADITAATLKAAVIEGYDIKEAKNSASLTIRNTDKAIRFIDSKNKKQLDITNEKMTLSVPILMGDFDDNGHLLIPKIVLINEKGIGKIKSDIIQVGKVSENDDNTYTYLEKNGLNFISGNKKVRIIPVLSKNEEAITFQTGQTEATESQLTISSSRTVLRNNLSFNYKINFNYIENNGTIGYDLFIEQ